MLGVGFASQEGRDTAPDIATSPRRQPGQPGQPGQPHAGAPLQGLQGLQGVGLRPKDPPPMVIQGDFRKVKIATLLVKTRESFTYHRRYL